MSINEYQQHVDQQPEDIQGETLYRNALARIRQLEELNKTLAAEVDAQRLVVQAACDWAHNDKGLLRIRLRTAVINYESSKPE